VPNIISGSGKLDELEIIFRKLKIFNPILITDQGIKKLGYIKIVENLLAKINTNLIVFDEVKADPPEKNIFDAVKIAKRNKCDAVIGLGGGSSMDVAKAVSYFSVNDEAIKDCYGVGNLKSKRMPLIQIPTTAGTGSEVTNIAIFTLESTQKMGIVDPVLYADYVILDATLTLKLPNTITAYSGIDAMVHAIEAYTTRLKKNPISDALAREALYLLGNNIKLVNKEPNNIKARENMLLGSTLAGMAFTNAPCAGVHALAYPIGAIFKVPHGLSNSLVLPEVIKFNSVCAEALYIEIADLCFPDLKNTDFSINDFINEIYKLIEELKIPKTLNEVGVSQSDIPKLAGDAVKQERLLVNNPVKIEYKDAVDIYKATI
tara:strand:+ start:3966 stop:5090 length:1125 start_codon:yes stop_codon:yes gene_type:complete